MRNYISVDIETDGLVAGRNNMISLGAAAIDMDNGHIVNKFKMNLTLVPDLIVDKETMLWWKLYPQAYEAARAHATAPNIVMEAFVDWVHSLATQDSIIFGWKPILDLAFLRYYIHRFHPFGTKLCLDGIFARHGFGLDQKTVAAIALKQPYRKTKMDNLPNSLRLNEEGEIIANHSHDALEDATEQAYIFYNAVRRLGVEL